MTTTTVDTRPREIVQVGSARMPYTERDPVTRQFRATTWDVYATTSPWQKVGELWFNPRTRKWTAYRLGYGVLLTGTRDTRQEAADVAGWALRER